MNSLIKFEEVENKIISIRGIPVLLDSDVAELYGIETKDINRAVKNNPEKFIEGYVFETSLDEKNELVKNFHQFEKLKHSSTPPKAFTEKGLYMLATILKGSRAIETTIAIIETFTKFRELTRTISAIQDAKDEPEQKSLMQKGGEIIADLLDDGLSLNSTETTIELNLAMIKIKHSINRKK
jgi:phage regulator Rha-like protein